MQHPVVITSWGAVFGALTENDLINAAFQDQDISHHKQPDLTPLQEILPQSELVLMGPHAQQACLAMERAWSKANLWQERNLLRGKGNRFRHPRAAIIAGSSLGMIHSALESQHLNHDKLSPYTLSKIRGNSIAAPLAIRWGLGAGDFSVSAASATGGQAIWLAAQLIQSQVADIVVVVCADVSTKDSFTDKVMHAVGAVARSKTSRPLCAQRNGMRPVNASTAIILESESHAMNRGIKPLARWKNGRVKNDCHHLIAPEPDALGLEEAVKELLHQTPIIDWLALHATGTKAWDEIEARLIHNIFQNDIPHISAFKRTFGHTLSSACLLSIAMIAEGLSQQRLPMLPQNIDPHFKLNLQPTTKETIQYAMNWSVGMGGTTAVNIFEACHV